MENNQEILAKHIESILFVADQEVTLEEFSNILSQSFGIAVSQEEISKILDILMEKYESKDFVYRLMPINEGYRLLTHSEYHKTISQFIKVKSKRRLSGPTMETLAIIAYKQPITKGVIESIRGVKCYYSIQKLLEKELIEIVGRSEAVGRPLLYGTSRQFMDHFGLKTINDLPQIKEIVPDINQIGETEVDANEALPEKSEMEIEQLTAENIAHEEETTIIEETLQEEQSTEDQLQLELPDDIEGEQKETEQVRTIEPEPEVKEEPIQQLSDEPGRKTEDFTEGQSPANISEPTE